LLVNRHTYNAQGVHPKVACGALDADKLTLAVPRSFASCVVVGEPAVVTGTVDGDVLAVVDANTKGVTVAGQAGAEVRVKWSRGGVVRAVRRVGLWLIVPGKEDLLSEK
jgi:hypothetical protein